MEGLKGWIRVGIVVLFYLCDLHTWSLVSIPSNTHTYTITHSLTHSLTQSFILLISCLLSSLTNKPINSRHHVLPHRSTRPQRRVRAQADLPLLLHLVDRRRRLGGERRRIRRRRSRVWGRVVRGRRGRGGVRVRCWVSCVFYIWMDGWRDSSWKKKILIYKIELYTDESPGLKVDPVVVLVLSLVFIFSVVALHVIAKITRKFSS